MFDSYLNTEEAQRLLKKPAGRVNGKVKRVPMETYQIEYDPYNILFTPTVKQYATKEPKEKKSKEGKKSSSKSKKKRKSKSKKGKKSKKAKKDDEESNGEEATVESEDDPLDDKHKLFPELEDIRQRLIEELEEREYPAVNDLFVPALMFLMEEALEMEGTKYTVKFMGEDWDSTKFEEYMAEKRKQNKNQ
jgi:hypothetical protein